MKLVEQRKIKEDNDVLDLVVRKIQAEIMDVPKQKVYCPSQFKHHAFIDRASSALFQLVSSLIADGTVTKQSITLAQCVQQHIAG